MRPRPEHEMYRHPTPPPLEGFSEKLEADEFPVAPISEFEDELTPEEERRLVWKGNALTDFFFRDVGITQNQFNTGQLLLPLAIILVEIPCNIILFKLGPQIWIAAQIFAWGTVATLQAFQKGLAAFLITRILLGICEAGFVPASLYTLTTWYKRSETSKRFAIFYIGNLSAGAASGLIAYGILQMRGIRGLAGWQWLFILEGLLTIIVGFLFLALFPKDPDNPISMFGYRYFTEREAAFLSRRVLADDPKKEKGGNSISLKQLKGAVTNWKMYPHLFVTISGLAPIYVFGAYAPTLVASFGFERLVSNALLGCRVLVYSPDGNLRFALLTLAIAFCAVWQPVNASWMSMNCRSPEERSIAMALFTMATNVAGIVASHVFQQEDRPLYVMGWNVNISLITAHVVIVVGTILQYVVLNRKHKKAGSMGELYSY
ncbi:hypothetical protein RJ035_005948 [Blastomyces gilchristii]